MHYRTLSAFAVCLATVLSQPSVNTQNDPGPRSGPAGAGGFYSSLNTNEQNLFNQASDKFKEVDSVLGTLTGEEGKGLGPGFNGNSCAQCHAQPAVGGSSSGIDEPADYPPREPAGGTCEPEWSQQFTLPSFITVEWSGARGAFHHQSRWLPRDGGVHGSVYRFTGRSDAQRGALLAQPDFTTAVTDGNVIFRIPTPLFRLGLGGSNSGCDTAGQV